MISMNDTTSNLTKVRVSWVYRHHNSLKVWLMLDCGLFLNVHNF